MELECVSEPTLSAPDGGDDSVSTRRRAYYAALLTKPSDVKGLLVFDLWPCILYITTSPWWEEARRRPRCTSTIVWTGYVWSQNPENNLLLQTEELLITRSDSEWENKNPFEVWLKNQLDYCLRLHVIFHQKNCCWQAPTLHRAVGLEDPDPGYFWWLAGCFKGLSLSLTASGNQLRLYVQAERVCPCLIRVTRRSVSVNPQLIG